MVRHRRRARPEWESDPASLLAKGALKVVQAAPVSCPAHPPDHTHRLLKNHPSTPSWGDPGAGRRGRWSRPLDRESHPADRRDGVERASDFRLPGERAGSANNGVGGRDAVIWMYPDRTVVRSLMRAARGRVGAGSPWRRHFPHGFRCTRPWAVPDLPGVPIFVGAIVFIVFVPVSVAGLTI